MKRQLNVDELRVENEELSHAKTAMLNLLEDIDEEKRLIAEEKTRTEAIMQSIDDAVIAVDGKGIITYANASSELFFGTKPIHTLGKSYLTSVVFDRNKETYADKERPVSQVLKTGSAMSIPLAYFGTGMKPVSMTLAPIRYEGKMTGVVIVIRDIEKERAEAELKENFIALVTHQLRSPLGSIRWYTEILGDKDLGTLETEQKEFVDRIQYGVGRLIETVDALLALSKIEGGLIVDSKKETDVCELARDAFEVERAGVLEKNLRVNIICPKKVLGIKVNATLLRQVVGNVISNAVRYTRPNGKITVTVKAVADQVCFEVSDNGIGVPEREQPKLFTKFYRASNAKAFAPQGSGLGLMLVKKIAETIGGNVALTSKLNTGTKVVVNIPMRTASS
jgi:PAS domain S-box-containing protein